jgi:hypothetical protein
MARYAYENAYYPQIMPITQTQAEMGVP